MPRLHLVRPECSERKTKRSAGDAVQVERRIADEQTRRRWHGRAA